MSLDDELRSAFAQEARTRVAPPPDPDGLIRGGRVRRRRRTLERAGAGAVAAALTAAGAYGLLPLRATDDPGVASPPSGAAAGSTTDQGRRPELAPGTYRRSVGYSATGPRIEAAFTVDGDNWSDGDFPLVAERFGSVFAGVGIYQPSAIATGNGCLDSSTTSDVGDTPRLLAAQLAQLPRSTVLQGPVATRAFGHSGQYLRLRIDVECGSTYYRVAQSPTGDRGITYTLPEVAKDVVIDLWVLEVAGTVVVVDQWHNVDASDALVAQTDRARDSIELITGE